MSTLKWLVATHNKGKLAEIRRILEPFSIELLSLDSLGVLEESPETGNSFLANALQKADFYRQRTGLPVLADDSGLEVDSLGGEPGVYSARFGGFASHREIRAFLLGRLFGVPDHRRSARFHCVAVYDDGKQVHHADGVMEGFIGHKPLGEGGFGYDPIFHPILGGPTTAQISISEKNRISHRGKAFFALVQKLKSYNLLSPN